MPFLKNIYLTDQLLYIANHIVYAIYHIYCKHILTKNIFTAEQLSSRTEGGEREGGRGRSLQVLFVSHDGDAMMVIMTMTNVLNS